MPARVLIAGGFFPRAKSIEAILCQAGFDVAISTKDADCVALCRADWPDVVLVDGTVPGSDPLELCRELKKTSGGGHAAVLVLTDGAQPSQRLWALDAGADECLCQPLDAFALVARLRSLAQWKSHSDDWRRLTIMRGLVPAEELASVRARVLVLDPDERSRERLTHILDGEDFDVTCLPDIPQALAGTAQGAYEIVLIGLAWSDLKGAKLCQQIRLLERGRHPRLLLVTNGEPLRAQCLAEYGIDDFILRPIDRNEALARVRLARRKQALITAVRNLSGPRGEGASIRSASRRRPASPDRFAA